MVEHILELWRRREQCDSSTFAFLALASRAAEWPAGAMIEPPHEFMNAIFAAVIIVANVRRLRNRLRRT